MGQRTKIFLLSAVSLFSFLCRACSTNFLLLLFILRVFLVQKNDVCVCFDFESNPMAKQYEKKEHLRDLIIGGQLWAEKFLFEFIFRCDDIAKVRQANLLRF
jgi:hypothetical protein